MKIKHEKTISDKLSKYDYLVPENSSNNYIEVTEWSNGEGITITIGDKMPIDLTYGELEAINYLTKTLEYDETVLCNRL